VIGQHYINITVDGRQIGHPEVGPGLEVSGDGRGVTQSNSLPDTEQVLNASGLSESGGRPF
jgi:hypothetical protein